MHETIQQMTFKIQNLELVSPRKRRPMRARFMLVFLFFFLFFNEEEHAHKPREEQDSHPSVILQGKAVVLAR